MELRDRRLSMWVKDTLKAAHSRQTDLVRSGP